jgi:hypothetical protein
LVKFPILAAPAGEERAALGDFHLRENQWTEIWAAPESVCLASVQHLSGLKSGLLPS